MQEVRLTAKKRAFPSQGRVRLNIAHLPDLGIAEGGHVDLINQATRKTVTTTVIADTMVREGQVRVSEEDLKTLGLLDDEEVLVRKTPPLEAKIRKAAADASVSLDAAVKKTAGTVKGGAGKAADAMKKETKKASDAIGKTASKTAKGVKKAVKKATGDEDL